MRSSKQRSRNKQNRNRPTGNIVNRVFDSSGPEGKVRGTPQQIIDKYNQLARDAQLSGDRVATENFQQHAEHYTRMLAEAMREQEARREAQEAQHRERQQQRAAERDDRGGGGQSQPSPVADQASAPQPEGMPQPVNAPQPGAEAGDSDSAVIDMSADKDSGLVETPESKPAQKPRQRRPRKRPEASGDGPAEAAE